MMMAINDTGATRSGWNGEDDNASSTLVLNIVAQVPPSEVEKSKADDISTKKKVNKFDRRRRRRARELEQQQRAENNLRVEDGGENNPREGRGCNQNANNRDTEATKEPSAVVKDGNNGGSVSARIPKTATVPAIRSTSETLDEAFPTVSEYTTPSLSPSNTRTSTKTNQVKHSKENDEDEQERARYMAEFHARPMELDRRSRASATTIVRDKEHSNHLFSSAVTSWSQFRLHSRIVNAMESSLDLSQPTLIQARALSAILGATAQNDAEGLSSTSPVQQQEEHKAYHHNILIHSETGSGKTLAYLLPILQSLAVVGADSSPNRELRKCSNRIEYGTKCLILCPTRELAAQTFALTERLCAQTFHWIVPGCLLGGGGNCGEGSSNNNSTSSRKSEKMRLRKGLGIIVATPGRLLDHLCKTESLLLALKGGKLEWLVLDEADRLLDMGLGEQVKQIVQRITANHCQVPRARNTTSTPQSSLSLPSSSPSWWRSVLVSATVTSAVQQLATETLSVGVGMSSQQNQSWVWVKGTSKETADVETRPRSNDRSAQPRQSPSVQLKINGSSQKIKEENDNDEDEDRDKQERDATKINHDHLAQLADSTPRQLAQWHMTVSAKWRLSALVALLVQRVVQQKHRAVVFLSTCASVDFYYALFHAMESILDGNDGDDDDDKDSPTDKSSDNRRGIFGPLCPIYKLHGRVPHEQRQEVLRKFLNHRSSKHQNKENFFRDEKKEAAILLATDVAARGLNLHDCDWTIQYDPPAELSDYVHRAGRVARAGKSGHSLLFLLPSERDFLTLLKQRGIAHLPAVSLADTLTVAATRSCKALTKVGVQRSGGGTGSSMGLNKHGNSKTSNANRRLGEAFSLELQRRLEDCVILTKEEEEGGQNKLDIGRRKFLPVSNQCKAGNKGSSSELLELARAAFLSHIRAYPTREKCAKHVFAAKALHLGHVARSFALKETPKRLASSSGGNFKGRSSKDAAVTTTAWKRQETQCWLGV